MTRAEHENHWVKLIIVIRKYPVLTLGDDLMSMRNIKITADELFVSHNAIKDELKSFTPIAAANAKKIELWADGSGFYFEVLISSGAKRRYPRVQVFNSRPEALTPAAGKRSFPLNGLISDNIVTEVEHDGSYFYVWNLKCEELDHVLYGSPAAA